MLVIRICTDDFVPFVVDRLNKLRRQHNILLVTNDHVETLTKMADNTITVSAIDRTKVQINEEAGIDRNNVLMALSVGKTYKYADTDADLRFFLDVELWCNKAVRGLVAFTLVAFGLFIATFWDSDTTYTAALLLIAAGIVGFFCIQPYLVSLVEWRDCMLEEAEALVHASPVRSKVLKASMTLTAIVLISVIEFIAVNVTTESAFWEFKFWIAMLGELFSLCFPAICVGIFSRVNFQTAQLLGGLPFLLVIFFSTTYSPGAGVPGLKGLRYLFSRFYYFCMIDSVKDQMEKCPKDDVLNVVLLVITSLESLFIFLAVLAFNNVRMNCLHRKEDQRMATSQEAREVERLQDKLYENDESIISMCTLAPPVPEMHDPTMASPDPSGIVHRFKYPPMPQTRNDRDHSFLGMTVIGA